MARHLAHLFHRFDLVDSIFFQNLDPANPEFRHEFSDSLNNLATVLRRDELTREARMAYRLSVEVRENEVALIGLVLLLNEEKSLEQAQKFARRFISLLKRNPETMQILKQQANGEDQSGSRFHGATVEFMEAIAEGKIS